MLYLQRSKLIYQFPKPPLDLSKSQGVFILNEINYKKVIKKFCRLKNSCIFEGSNN